MKLFVKFEDNVPLVYAEDGGLVDMVQDVKMERSSGAAGLHVTMTFFVSDEDERVFTGRDGKIDQSTGIANVAIGSPGTEYVIVDHPPSGETALYIEGNLAYWRTTEHFPTPQGVQCVRCTMIKKSMGWPQRIEDLSESQRPLPDPPCSRPQVVLVFDRRTDDVAAYGFDGKYVFNGRIGSDHVVDKLKQFVAVDTFELSADDHRPCWPDRLEQNTLKEKNA